MKKVKQRQSGGTTPKSGSAKIIGVLTQRDSRASVITAVDMAIESDLGSSDLHGADLNLATDLTDLDRLGLAAPASDAMGGTVTYSDLDGLVSPDLHTSDSAIGSLLATP